MNESEEGVASPEELAAEELTDELPTRASVAALPSRDRSILNFERDWKRSAGAKEDAVHSEFGLTSARYYQVLHSIIDSPEALAYDPMLVKRLQRMRETRASARTLMTHSSNNTPSPN